jgi:enolase
MNKSKIKDIRAREILDSRGNPTVEAEVETGLGVFVASVPSGASTGKYEAAELRDGGKRYSGKGVLKAVENVNNVISQKLKGKDAASQKDIDDLLIKLDGTENKSFLGANSICPVSLAVCKAGAKARNFEIFQYIREIFNTEYKIPAAEYKMPLPSFNIINGGAHAGNNLDVQEFMVLPQKKLFSDNLRLGAEIYHQLKIILSKRFGNQSVNLGDEGGFAPPLADPEQALDLIMMSVKDSGYEKEIKIVLDVAASQFFENGKYKMKFAVFTREGLLRYYSDLASKYPIAGLEDPFSEDDWEGFTEITKKLGKKISVIGDDLLVTNPHRIKEAEEKKAVTSMILKINQIGTVSEALEAAKLAKDFNWKIMVSHRSGETTDSFISDFAVGISADFIKSGAPSRGERVVKYNRLLEIEQKIL